MAGKYDEHIYFINEQYDATHTNPLNTTAHIYQYFSDWLNDLQVQSTGNNSWRAIQLNSTTILGSDTTTGPLKFGNSNAHNVIFSYTSGQLYADVGSNVFVDLLNNQTIDGQKDFNTVPRVKVTHETHNLPDTYQEVEYIESTGTQYIDTGLVGTVNTSYLVTAQAASNTAMLLFGSRTSATSNNLMCSTSDAYCLVDFGNYQQTRLQIIVSTNKFTAYNSKNLRYINDTQSTVAYSGSLTTPGTMRIFDLSGNPPVGNTKWNGKLFICKVWDSDVLVREFIPCYRKSDNEVGLYDIVNNVFYTNQGTGDLIAGPDIAPVTYESLLTDANFAPVAFSGSYTDLINQPTIPIVNNATLTIQKNGTTVQSFTANASSNVTANITVPTKTSDLTNDSGYITSSYHDSTKEDTSNKVTSISSSSTDAQYPTAKCVYDNIENIREVAEGKKQTYVVSDVTNPAFNSQADSISITSFQDINYNTLIPSELSVGDTVYVKESDVPDRWVEYLYAATTRLPQEYQEVQYIYQGKQSDSGTTDLAYIAPGVSFADIDAVEFDISISFSSSNKNNIILAAYSTNFYIIVSDNNHTANGFSNVVWSPNNADLFSDGERHTLLVSGLSSNNTTPIRTAWDWTWYQTTHWYGLKFYKNNVLLKHLIPCYRRLDSVVGMYDIVNNTFFTNAGQGNLLAGPSVRSEDEIRLAKLETVKPNIASISVNGTSIAPVNENVDITVSNQTIKAKNNGTNVTFGSNDVVEIVAGSNVSISANASAKTITINASGGGGGGSTSVRVNDVTYSPDASGIVTLPNYPIIEDLTSQ